MNHFETYLNKMQKVNLHPKINKLIQNLPTEFKNMIIYGPQKSGKYSQALHIISKYSQSKLKYEKKVVITKDVKEDQFIFKMSDIHFEIDMFLLGCNSKTLWFTIYQHILDIICLRKSKQCIIMCKNFHLIHNELLDLFYSYMQQNFLNINICFLLITEELSFIPNNILDCCEVLHIPKPYKSNVTKCNKIDDTIDYYKHIIDIDTSNFIKMRNSLYNIFIYQLNVYTCVWLICKKMKKNDVSKMFQYLLTFFHGYNNNYRHIFHLELLLHNLSTIE